MSTHVYGIVLNVDRFFGRLASQDDDGVCAAEQFISARARPLICLPRIVEGLQALEKGGRVDLNVAHICGAGAYLAEASSRAGLGEMKVGSDAMRDWFGEGVS